MVKFYTVFILLVFCLSLSSQDEMEFPKRTIGFTPTALVNFYPGIQLSYDQALSPKLNLSTESAFLMSSLDILNTKGGRIRIGLESFVARSSWVSLVSGIHLNLRSTATVQTVTTRATNGEFQFINYNRLSTDRLVGLSFENKLLFKASPRWYISLGSGLGGGLLRTKIFPTSDRLIPDNQGAGGIIPSGIFYTHLNFSYSLSL